MIKKSIHTVLRKLRVLPGLDWIVLGLGLTIFILLVLHSINASSIWFDEAFSAYIAQFSFADIAKYTGVDVHPPLYYWTLKIWTGFFGTTELALRSLSLLFGSTTIAAGYVLVKRLFGRKAAWVSLLLLIISPMLIRYSQEARMYTMAATIALGATYVLTCAVESKRRRDWVIYGLLVGLGMWTHYFTAVVWLAHWVWRAIVTKQSGQRGKKYLQAFFSKDWVIAHVVAVGIFLPWIPYMVTQLTGIQGGGFWINPVTADTFTNYLSNILFYLEHLHVLGWYAFVLVLIIVLLCYFAVKTYRTLNKKQRQSYLLLVIIAFVPVLILFLVSLPPLKSSFVDRYLIPSVAGFSLFAGVTLVLGTKQLKTVWRVAIIALIAGSMVVGVLNVYYYGNYNRDGQGHGESIKTGEVVKEIANRSKKGEPIIAASPWAFYEAIVYTTADHPVYFVDADTKYIYGSLKMLQDTDLHKITDKVAFASEHPVVWVVGNMPLPTPPSTWKELQHFTITDPISGKNTYGATQFQTNAE